MNEQSIAKRLTTKSLQHYVLAFMLIAGAFVTSYLLQIHHLKESDASAYIINISGMQRMLSQRISLLSHEAIQATPAERTEFANELRVATQKMQTNLDQLEAYVDTHIDTSSIAKELHSAYHEKSGVGEHVRNYLSIANELKPHTNTNEVTNILHRLKTSLSDGLLQKLNETVKLHQLYAEQQIDDFRNLEFFIMLTGIGLLILEAIFIFSPMIQQIHSTALSLEESNGELIEFSYRISHDVRAPLISARGLVELASRQVIHEKTPERALKTLSYAEESLTKLDKLTIDIIELTKNKLLRVKFEPVDIEQLVMEAYEGVSHLPNAADVHFELVQHIPQNIHTVPLLLKQSLENLFSNAIKYADMSKPTPTITCIAEHKGDSYILHIRDNGLGIAEQHRAKIFKMFQRFHPRTAFGSGLGLYLVKKNVTLLQGTIEYKPLDEGSEFILTLPSLPTVV